jgi:hypothetical protein
MFRRSAGPLQSLLPQLGASESQRKQSIPAQDALKMLNLLSSEFQAETQWHLMEHTPSANCPLKPALRLTQVDRPPARVFRNLAKHHGTSTFTWDLHSPCKRPPPPKAGRTCKPARGNSAGSYSAVIGTQRKATTSRSHTYGGDHPPFPGPNSLPILRPDGWYYEFIFLRHKKPPFVGVIVHVPR